MMKRKASAACCLVVLTLLSLVWPAGARAQGQSDMTGHWEGTIQIPGTPLGIIVDLKSEGGAWSGTVEIPLQGAQGLPLTAFDVQGNKIKFSIQGIPGSPTFDGTLAQGKIQGDFAQGGQTFPFSLGREKTASPKRPQEPKPPFPYKAEEVTFQNQQVTLAGTLTIPAGKGPFPAVILFSGSGPQDRDEAIFGHRPFLVLADHLSRAGIAVLRVDDRGVGKSTGALSKVGIPALVEDGVEALRFLLARPEIDPKRIGLVGHSEGGLIAPIISNRTPDVAFLVLLAAPGFPGDDILRQQTEKIYRVTGAPEEKIQAMLSEHLHLLSMVKAGRDSTELIPQAKKLIVSQVAAQGGESPPETALDDLARSTVSQMSTPWFMSFLKNDPRSALRMTRVPTLVLFGDLDLQVIPDLNIPQIETTLQAAGNRNVTIKRFPGLNHLFQKAESGMIQEYATIEQTIDPEVLTTITEWIQAGFGNKKSSSN